MHFTEKTLKTLEFDKIINMLVECAATDGAKARARALAPSDDYDVVVDRLTKTDDAKRLINAKGYPAFSAPERATAAADRAYKGATLSPAELLDVASLLRSARALLDYINTDKPFETKLDGVFARLIANRTLEDKITRSILSEDMIADEASRELAEIRRKIRITNNKIKDTLQSYMGGVRLKYLQENIVTMRNGRYVVPVKSEYRNEMQGLVHDTSSSGATLFVEPMAVVEANNELKSLAAAEEHEIERILSELSAECAECSSVITLDYHNITDIAFYYAAASLALNMRAERVNLVKEPFIDLKRARHPLINKEKVVPIDVSLGGEYTSLVVTGPNTGGKTVTLKTMGLFALMTQSGLEIPALETSSIGIFSEILVDIGDEQSIEASLSTFSSHMVNVADILNRVGNSSLVLFDELGSGTDPVEGAALAVAIIESVRDAGACCVATTHYAELKAYALDTPGVCNASCEFDVETLKPTYKLIIGAPGKSNAFAISAKLGLDPAIIERARARVSSENKSFESVIEQLESSRVQMEKERAEAKRLREEYERFKTESEKKIRQRLESAEKEAESTRKKAAAMVQSAKASCDFIYEQMEKMKKAQEAAQAAAELEAARRAVRDHLRTTGDLFDPIEVQEEDEGYVLPRPLKKGDKVRIVTIHKEGVVTEDPKGNLVAVQAGVVRTKARLEDLRLIEEDERGQKKKPAQKSAIKSSVTVERSNQFKSEIDLRGMTGDEAWLAVDKYLDDAIMYNMQTVHLIHGKGTGALKNALWQFLRSDKRIASFRIGRYGEGDGGVTVVEMK